MGKVIQRMDRWPASAKPTHHHRGRGRPPAGHTRETGGAARRRAYRAALLKEPGIDEARVGRHQPPHCLSGIGGEEEVVCVLPSRNSTQVPPAKGSALSVVACQSGGSVRRVRGVHSRYGIARQRRGL